jgi:hypothetical protein
MQPFRDQRQHQRAVARKSEGVIRHLIVVAREATLLDVHRGECGLAGQNAWFGVDWP